MDENVVSLDGVLDEGRDELHPLLHLKNNTSIIFNSCTTTPSTPCPPLKELITKFPKLFRYPARF